MKTAFDLLRDCSFLTNEESLKIQSAMKEYAKQYIEKAAERALLVEDCNDGRVGIPAKEMFGDFSWVTIDESSILSLIEELK